MAYQQQCHPPPQTSQYYGQPHHGGMAPQYQMQQEAPNPFAQSAYAAMSFSSEDQLKHVFYQHMNQDIQGIQAQELYNILNQNEQIRSYYGIAWSMELCKIMLAMMDRNKSGTMQYGEFDELLKCLVFWRTTFCSLDGDRSGYIESQELMQCIRNKFGYSIQPNSLQTLLQRYSRLHAGRCLIAFDDFVSVCVRLRAYTEAFRARDRQCNGRETGTATFQYDDFIQCVMCL